MRTNAISHYKKELVDRTKVNINKKYKGVILEDFLRDFNITKLTFEQKQIFLHHIQKCHQFINKSNHFIYEDLIDKTMKLFQRFGNLNNVDNLKLTAVNFLFLITHRNGVVYDGYTNSIKNLINMLDSKIYKDSIDSQIYKDSIDSNVYYEDLNKMSESLDLAKLHVSKKCLFEHKQKIRNIDIIIKAIKNKLNGDDQEINSDNPQITKILDLIKNKYSLNYLTYEIGRYLNTHRNKFGIFNYGNYTKSYVSFFHNFFNSLLDKWVNEASSDKQKKARLSARESIKSVYETNSKVLNLSNKNLDEVPPRSILKYVRHINILNLGNNKIKEIKAGAFNDLGNVIKLNLNNNKIKEISVGSFDGLRQLTDLYLENSGIEEIKADAFSDLGNVIKLNLNNNKIKEISAGSFNGLRQLTDLYLENSGIEEIKADAFSDLGNVIKLSLNKNKIKEISAGSFNGLKQLKSLHLFNNEIEEIKAYAFNDLGNLKNLSLRSNKIKDIELGSFIGLGNLGILFLENNKLEEIKPNSFSGLDKLRTLYLDNNKIKRIKTQYFGGLPNLINLQLDYNPIEEIEEGALDNVGRLSSINVLEIRRRISMFKPQEITEPLTFEEELMKLFKRVGNLTYKLTFNWNNSNMVYGFRDFISRINRVRSVQHGNDLLIEGIYNNLVNIIIIMDQDESFRNDCNGIAVGSLGNCYDPIFLGYLRMVIYYNILDRENDYNSIRNIFNRIRYHSTFDYIAGIVASKIEQLNKSLGEGVELQLLTLLNVDISSLLKLPKGHMSPPIAIDFVNSVFYNNKLRKLKKDQKYFVKMVRDYFNNLDNFYLKLLDHEVIQKTYEAPLANIARKYENEEANGNITAYNKRKSEQVRYLKDVLKNLNLG